VTFRSRRLRLGDFPPPRTAHGAGRQGGHDVAGQPDREHGERAAQPGMPIHARRLAMRDGANLTEPIFVFPARGRSSSSRGVSPDCAGSASVSEGSGPHALQNFEISNSACR
jgi:hypothetical protein